MYDKTAVEELARQLAVTMGESAVMSTHDMYQYGMIALIVVGVGYLVLKSGVKAKDIVKEINDLQLKK